MTFLFQMPFTAESFADYLDDAGIDYDINQCMVRIDESDDSDELRAVVDDYGGTICDEDEYITEEDEEE